ncbi:MAG TPA: hypothetical protein ACQGQH_08750 [Xylella sp.]
MGKCWDASPLIGEYAIDDIAWRIKGFGGGCGTYIPTSSVLSEATAHPYPTPEL